MTLYTAVKAIVDRVATDLTAAGFTVKYGAVERLANELPYAVIAPVDYPLEDAATGGHSLHLTVELTILVLIKALNPKVWFEDISEMLLKVPDALLADRTLGGLVYYSLPKSSKPDRITAASRTYFGGVVIFTAKANYTVP